MGKRTKIYISILSLVITALVLITLLFISIFKSVSYKPLDKCFITSVSKAQLCNASASYSTYSEISPYLINAVITSEDDKFFMHNGVDWKELKNSMWLNLKHFSYKRGGSTITQQLVKNAYLTQEKSITRKIKELAIAYDIENKYSKKLILEKYLNAIEYGPNLWGIQKASNFYFNKPPKDLGVLESLYLAILLPSPKKYSQSFRDKKLTYYQKRRIKILLNRLVRKKIVDTDYSKILLDDIDGFPWSISDANLDINTNLQQQELDTPVDLSDPNINFNEVDDNHEESQEIKKLKGNQEINGAELSEEEVIKKFLEEETDQN